MDGSVGRLDGAVLFPRKVLLSGPEACAFLGIGRGGLMALRMVRSGPPSVLVRGRRLYREGDLVGFRKKILSEVGVSEGEGRYRMEGREGGKPDPLMRLLARTMVWRRVVLGCLWGMVLGGGFVGLVLF